MPRSKDSRKIASGTRKRFIATFSERFKWKRASFIGKRPLCSSTWTQIENKRNRLRDSRIKLWRKISVI